MAIVETSQPLSIESFSYSWLVNVNLKPSLIESPSESFRAALDSSDDSSSSFIEMDPNMPPSRRFMKLENDLDFNFNFNVPFSEQSQPVHADKLFRNGLLLPLIDSPTPNPVLDSVDRQKTNCSASLRRCRSLVSRKTFEKYLCFLCPLLDKMRLFRSKSRTSRRRTGGDNRICPVRTSVSSSPGDWRRSCDSESSIHEAVLHCKRSFERTMQ